MEETVKVSLVSVREVEGATAINRWSLRKLGRTPINVDFNVRVIPDLERSFISLVVSCSYITVLDSVRTRVLSCSVVSTFEIEDLMSHITLQGQDAVVGGKLMMTMLGIAVGSLRGIIAVRTGNTPLRFRPLPIIDLSAIMGQLRYGNSASSIIPM